MNRTITANGRWFDLFVCIAFPLYSFLTSGLLAVGVVCTRSHAIAHNIFFLNSDSDHRDGLAIALLYFSYC